jgi:hypothetical protein
MNKSIIVVMAVGLLSSLLIFMLESTEAGCGCNQWCSDHGYTWGICGDGHTCICYNPRERRRRSAADDDEVSRNREDDFKRHTFVLKVINN